MRKAFLTEHHSQYIYSRGSNGGLDAGWLTAIQDQCHE